MKDFRFFNSNNVFYDEFISYIKDYFI